MVTTAPALATAEHGRARRISAQVCTGLPALVVLAFGGQLLATGWTTDRAGGTHHVHDLAWGALEGLLLLGALVAVLVRRLRRPSAMVQALAVVATLLLTMVLVATPDPFTLVLSALVVAGVLLHKDRPLLQRRDPDRGLLALSAVSTAALVPWSLAAAADQRAGGDEHAELLGYTGVAAFAIALVTVLAVAALRLPGWRWTAGCAALAAGVVGAAGLLRPEDTSSPGALGGAGLLLLSAAVACCAARGGTVTA